MRQANGSRIENPTLAGLLCLVLSTAPTSAVTGYSVFDDQHLVAVDLTTGTVEELGDLSIGDVAEVAFDGDDLFVVAQVPPSSSLYRIDLETATESLVGDLGNSLAVTGLTFDADGTLWMATANALYTVDPETAATALIGLPDRPLLSLAARDGDLFGLTPNGFTVDVVAIDPDSAATSVEATLPEIFFNGGLLAGMAFDLTGSLWAYSVTLPPIEPHLFLQTFYEIGDPIDPRMKRTFSIEAPFVANPPLFTGLAVAPGVFDGAVAVPTLDRAGWTVLAAMLLGAGLMTLRRHRVAGQRE